MKNKNILLTGATGYVGGHLLKHLERDGYRVNCLVRKPESLTTVSDRTRVFKGDVMEPDSLSRAFDSIDVAFYLIHSLNDGNDFAEREKQAAMNFVEAARFAGTRRIIYLGGLGREEDGLSSHLRSRQEVGRILRESGIPTIELRASIVLGAGSISFEMIRSLTEHLPFMVTPKWVSVEAQPISIGDLVEYLAASIDQPLEESMVVEIGGKDRVSYRALMEEYARQRGLKRIMIPVPVLTPWLSSHWLGLITPVYAEVGRKLIEGVKNRTVVEHPEPAARYAVRPCGMAEAIRRALDDERREFEQGNWIRHVAENDRKEGHRIIHHHHLLLDYWCSHTEASTKALYDTVTAFGGSKGMFAWNSLWRLRAWLDRCMGGRSGVTNQAEAEGPMEMGKQVDFFHVEILDENRRVRLKTDMKLPGEAWLEFGIERGQKGSCLHHVIIYEPKGLLGLIYWYAIYPVHALVFRGMHRAILREALSETTERLLHQPLPNRLS